MVRIYKRIHALLARRARESRKENRASRGKDKELLRRYNESTKDLYAYVRIMDVCKCLLEDVENLRGVLDSLSESSMTFVTPDIVAKGRPN